MAKKINKAISDGVRGILANTDLSTYRVNQIVKAEKADPASWGVPGESSVTEKSILRYYENIHSQAVLINFINRLQAKHGISYYSHIKEGK